MKRFGSATWNGDLREGKGSVSTESRALESHPYTFFSRYGEKPGTNPEELLGAAHAACFTMSFVRMLGMANFVPEQCASKSEVVIEKEETASPSHRSMSLSPQRYRALTMRRSSRSQQGQRPAVPSRS
jgi:OsmC subfamily peroxiredoxin